MKRRDPVRLPLAITQAARVKFGHYFLLRDTRGVLLKSVFYNSGLIFINNQRAADRLISRGDRAADEFSFHCAIPPPALDLLRKIDGVVFRGSLQHSFKNDTFGVVADILHRGQHLHARPLQCVFINCAVIAVPREAIELIDDHIIEGVLLRVGDHALEIGAIVRPSRKRAIYVFADDRVTFAGGVFVADTKLAIYALFVLRVRRKPRVYYRVQYVSLPFPPFGITRLQNDNQKRYATSEDGDERQNRKQATAASNRLADFALHSGF
ncbi:hypothetical protein UNSWDHB_2647 [Dehalobacter sp. UNSWDHB]|nr:hypothetical protein UNSWDHB_2647 [Dehalobacter sp. UNSWDHB]